MQLIASASEHFEALQHWFPNQASIQLWGGPKFRYPFSKDSFIDDLCLSKCESYSLVNQQGSLMGFGQFYSRLQCCHLARLAIAPSHRGYRLIEPLVNLLSAEGQRKLDFSRQSLFVLDKNTAAIKAYRRLGFSHAEYPKTLKIENCAYMVRESSSERTLEQHAVG